MYFVSKGYFEINPSGSWRSCPSLADGLDGRPRVVCGLRGLGLLADPVACWLWDSTHTLLLHVT